MKCVTEVNKMENIIKQPKMVFVHENLLDKHDDHTLEQFVAMIKSGKLVYGVDYLKRGDLYIPVDMSYNDENYAFEYIPVAW